MGDVYFHDDIGSRSSEIARRLIGDYCGTFWADGYEVYEAYEDTPWQTASRILDTCEEAVRGCVG